MEPRAPLSSKPFLSTVVTANTEVTYIYVHSYIYVLRMVLAAKLSAGNKEAWQHTVSYTPKFKSEAVTYATFNCWLAIKFNTMNRYEMNE